jgi:branched-chain amino acid aminotransferase
LAGITRELVLEWARADGIGVREEALPLQVLESCDEVFLTSSLKDVRPVTRVDARRLEVGPVTRDLMDLWAGRQADGMDP